MNHVKKHSHKRFSAVQIIRAVIQLTAFLLIPGLFISVLSAIGSIYTSLVNGTFVFAEQMGNIALTAAVFIVTAIWGRFFCGYICSFGAMQDLMWMLGKRIVRRPLLSEKVDRVMKYFKFAVLLYIVLAVWTFGVGENIVWSPWTVFGAYASPFKAFPNEMLFLSLGGALLLSTVIGSVLVERFFCRYLCPLGAIFTLLSSLRVFRIKKPSAHCGGCKGCTKSCSMSIPLYRYDEIRSGECINCMKCTTSCHRDNVKAAPIPAVSGTLAAAAIAGVTFMGTLPESDEAKVTQPATLTVSTEAVGKYKDGIYSGSAQGYRGSTTVTVRVSAGNISEITVESSKDDAEFLTKAKRQVIPDIIEAQDTDVEIVSGATFSSRGIINAVDNALESQWLTNATQTPTEKAAEAPTQNPTEAPTQPPTDPPTAAPTEVIEEQEQVINMGSFTDGVYTGSGSGFRGTTTVEVTVENGNITDIIVTSYQDDNRFFNNAQSGVISAILSEQSVDVSTVSGATFSSNSIKEAVANALGLSFSNPNSSMEGSKGGHGMH